MSEWWTTRLGYGKARGGEEHCWIFVYLTYEFWEWWTLEAAVVEAKGRSGTMDYYDVFV